MNLWDSVHRSLEKASQEAGRIARVQRTRSHIDKMSHQIEAQETAILNKVMELFTSGRLTQNELIPICQELIDSQQQLSQAQNELKQLQSQGSAPVPANPYITTTDMYTPPSLPPPGYQPAYVDKTMPATPPPPPGVEPLNVASQETLILSADTILPPPPPPPSVADKRLCTTCGTEALPENQYCHNCGALLQLPGSTHLPTVRASSSLSLERADEETARSELSPSPAEAEAETPAPEEHGGN